MKALFLDRDGVINVRLPGEYVTHPSEFQLIPGVKEALQLLKKKFDLFFVTTNQQGIGKKLMTHEELDAVHRHMELVLDFTFDGIYYCPYIAEYRPFCRKPQPGMAYQALRDFPSIDFSQSVMVGDMETDMQFAQMMIMQAVQVGPLPVSTYTDISYPSLSAYANALTREAS